MARIYLAGHRGMVGSAIWRLLQRDGHEIVTRSSDELDLRDQAGVRAFFGDVRPEEVILAAARVGGIGANSAYPADFIYDNLMIECNVVHEAFRAGTRKLLFLGSSCIYPKAAPQPMSEGALLTGPLEPTNEPYAIAKIAGIKLCESYNRQHGVDYRSVMPTNLYGPNDYFHPERSHVLPSLMMRFHDAARAGAEEIVVWGTGKPRREFLHVEDMAEASLFVAGLSPERYHAATEPMMSHLNVGCGADVTIRQLAELIADVTGFTGRISFDETKPDGTPRKLLDVGLLAGLGWKAKIALDDGIRETYQWFLANRAALRT